MATENKPCDKCPWTEKGQPLITDQLKETAKKGTWFCCHVNMGECFGAKNFGETQNRLKPKNKNETV